MNSPLLKLLEALDFAAKKHAGQRRKGVAREPYINHLIEVSLLLERSTGGEDPALAVAGVLHDTLEDTDTDLSELRHRFGADVAQLVAEVSDDRRLPRAERKRLQLETMGDRPQRARLLRIADKTSNLRSVIESPPQRWNRKRKLEYFQWAKAVVDQCRGLSPQLEAWFDEQYRQGLEVLSAPERPPNSRPSRPGGPGGKPNLLKKKNRG